MDSDFSEVDGSISLKLCAKKGKPIFDIQNGGLAAIFDVNTLGAIIWRTSPGFRSNLVQRDCIGGSATCMPFISCLVSKVATEWPYLLFLPPFSGLIPPNVLGIGQSYFVHPQTVLQISIPFQRSYISNYQLAGQKMS